MARRRGSVIGGTAFVAGALVRATGRAVVGATLEVATEVAEVAGRVAARQGQRSLTTAGSVARQVVSGELGIGPLRVDPDDVARARLLVARGLRSLLAASDETAEQLRTADPTTMARAVLALVGGDEALVPLPTPEDQIRQRFRDLLDPTDDDRGTLAPALLTITAQLSPDEARILRHLAGEHETPVVAVREGSWASRGGPVVAEHLSVVVERSGGDHPDRGRAYLDDLVRLGLVHVVDGDDDHPDIPLVEATAAYRAAVAQVRESGGRPRQDVGRLRLTGLGADLVAIALDRHEGPEDRPLVDGAAPADAATPSPRPVRVRVEKPRRDPGPGA